MNNMKPYKYVFDNEIATQMNINAKNNMEGGQVATITNSGFQMACTNPLFDDWLSPVDINGPKSQNGKGDVLLDVGAAYGINTLTALHQRENAKVIALDMSGDYLSYIRAVANKEGIPQERLTTILGRLPELEGIESNSVSSILCADVIHFLSGADIEASFKRFYDILVPGGKILVSSHGRTVAEKQYQQNETTRKIYDAKIKRDANDPYPTFFTGDDWSELFKNLMQDKANSLPDLGFVPSQFHYLTVSQIANIAEKSNFVIEYVKQSTHQGYPEQIIHPRHHLQILAFKPI